MASAMTHAIIVQVTALITAIVFWARPFPYLEGARELGNVVNITTSAIGMFLTAYGIILIIAVVLSLFRLMVLVPPPKSKGKPELQ